MVRVARAAAWEQEWIDAGWLQDDDNPHIWWKKHWDGRWQRWKQPASHRRMQMGKYHSG